MTGFVHGFTMTHKGGLVVNSTMVAAEEMQTASKLRPSVRECAAGGSVSNDASKNYFMKTGRMLLQAMPFIV